MGDFSELFDLLRIYELVQWLLIQNLFFFQDIPIIVKESSPSVPFHFVKLGRCFHFDSAELAFIKFGFEISKKSN